MPAPSGRSAQRLSASTEGTHHTTQAARVRSNLCSTPFGINGRNTASPHAIVDRVEQCSTPFGINGRNTIAVRAADRPGTEVLNAFRHQRKEHAVQRVHWAFLQLVLNAFRHQRKEHLAGVLDYIKGSSVLNAFRHQRKEHAYRPR